jgi:AcrR family transcriptional regulator
MVSKMGLRQRARTEEHKGERRDAILTSAEQMFCELAFGQITMADVAERAGLAKGTLYLYFATKERLFLALLERQLDTWFDDVDRRLASDRGMWDAARVARVFAESLAGRDQFTRLTTLLESVLEHNVDAETIRTFKEQLRDRLLATGANLEHRLPSLRRGDGARLLLHMRALVTGLRQMADCAPAVRQVIDEDPTLGVFHVDFERELAAALAALVRGTDRPTKGE